MEPALQLWEELSGRFSMVLTLFIFFIFALRWVISKWSHRVFEFLIFQSFPALQGRNYEEQFAELVVVSHRYVATDMSKWLCPADCTNALVCTDLVYTEELCTLNMHNLAECWNAKPLRTGCWKFFQMFSLLPSLLICIFFRVIHRCTDRLMEDTGKFVLHGDALVDGWRDGRISVAITLELNLICIQSMNSFSGWVSCLVLHCVCLVSSVLFRLSCETRDQGIQS